jgi:uncharacterized C2H2 Zn-finger protein
MKSRIAMALVLAVTLVAGSFAADKAADDAKAAKDLKCPVSGKACAEGTEVKYKEGEVVFCCPNCPKAFEKDTAKFAAKANQQLVASGQYEQVKCPIAGRPLNADTAIAVGDIEVSFCCKNCKAKATAAEGAEQVELIFNDKAFEKGFAAAKAE